MREHGIGYGAAARGAAGARVAFVAGMAGLLLGAGCPATGAGYLFAGEAGPGRRADSGSTPEAPPAAVISGTLGGMAMTVADTTYGVSGSAGAQLTVVLFSSTPRLCAELSANESPKSSRLFVLAAGVFNTSSGSYSAITSPGTYPIFSSSAMSPMGPFSLAQYTTYDATCSASSPLSAMSGTVTVTSLTAGSIAGRFDVTMQDGSAVSGTFEAPVCAAIANPPTSDAGMPICR